jgi:ectoine hydroxylase-related dioxygenase (phytanoyl-CoA dioxygenase family)
MNRVYSASAAAFASLGMSNYESVQESIEKEGFLVVPNFARVTSELLSAVCSDLSRAAKKQHAIFNGGSGGGGDMHAHEAVGDGKRKQIFVSKSSWSPAVVAFINEIDAKLRALAPGALIPKDMVFLVSESGCTDQPAHSDWTEEALHRVVDDGIFGGFPMGSLVALEPETFFNVWQSNQDTSICSCRDELFDVDTQYQRVRLELNQGDLLLFRADVVHSGASYDKRNIRMHAFLDRSTVKRRKATTQYMHENENVLV